MGVRRAERSGAARAGRALLVGIPASRGLLAATRSLARSGWEVGVASSGAGGLAASSRFAARGHLVPAVEEGVDRFVSAVAGLVRNHGYQVVFGGNEGEVLALSLRRSELGAVFPYARHETLERALDKQSLYDAAIKASIAVPRLLSPSAAIARRAAVIVKARRHAEPQRTGRPSRIDTNVVQWEQVERRVEEIERAGGSPLIQELVPGRLVAYCAVTDVDGSVVADVQQEATRISPPGAGASCRATTVEVDRDVAGKVAALLRSLGWFGLAEVQFVRSDEGTLKLIDLNGRFYGSLALAVAAGADLPAAWAALAVGAPAPRTTARPGVRYQWLTGDVRRARVERRGGLLADVAGCLRYAPRSRHSIWSAGDPVPAVTHLVGVLRDKALHIRRGAPRSRLV